MILFVGDKASKKNKDPNIPFVGTKSYKRLLEWIWRMDLDVTEIILANCHHVKEYGFENYYYVETPNMFIDVDEYCKVIALGKNAAKYLKECGIEHHELPHPSGLNRKLNDKEYTAALLERCADFIKN